MRRNLSFINLIKFLCANVVILCHYVLAFLPYILIGAEEKIHFGKFEKLIRDSVLYTLVNGTFCVYVFWVISGFLIYYAHSYDNTGKRQVKMALSKYFKPLAGIFLTNFLAYALQKVGAMRNIDASVIAHSEYQIASYYQNKASIIRLFYESLIGIYLDDPFKIYVNPLWTMKIEILGSFFLIILLSLSKQVKRNWALALITALGCFLIDVRIICFVFGALCAAYFVRKKEYTLFLGNCCLHNRHSIVCRKQYLIESVIYVLRFFFSDRNQYRVCLSVDYGCYPCFRGCNYR